MFCSSISSYLLYFELSVLLLDSFDVVFVELFGLPPTVADWAYARLSFYFEFPRYNSAAYG